ncbi:MAG TPA: hypothetical protein PK590_05150 [Candidatus Omnitrophota bacterium]|nr:hypothetical protein [Candidatus Omnitrophota bacterium]
MTRNVCLIDQLDVRGPNLTNRIYLEGLRVMAVQVCLHTKTMNKALMN